MKMAQLHLADISTRAALHDRLTEVLGLPDYYGRNLDALYDLLTDTGEQTFLWVYLHPQAEAALGDYLPALLDTLRDAAAENPALNVCIFEEEDA